MMKSPLRRGVAPLLVAAFVVLVSASYIANSSCFPRGAAPRMAAMKRESTPIAKPNVPPSAAVFAGKRMGQHACPNRGQLKDHGGPVEKEPKVYVDFWSWTSDPQGERPYLIRFLSSIGGSSWLSTVTQYCASDETEFAGEWTDTSSRAHRQPTDSEIQKEGKVAAEHFGVKRLFGGKNQNIQIIVALATGVLLPSTHSGDCAYHEQLGKFPRATTGPYLVLTALPYLADTNFATQCGASAIDGGTSGALDGVSITEGHELVESITDPEANAWYDDAVPASEIADKCQTDPDYDIQAGGHTFAVQELWSNVANACVVAGSTPGTPMDVQAIGVSAHIDVSWTAPEYDGGTPITSWLVTATPGSSICVESVHTYCSMADVTAGTTYSISVQASNAVGVGKASDKVMAMPSNSQNCSFFGDHSDLQGCDLSNDVLTNANLTNANLTGANLTNANLTNANLTNANLTHANLDDVTLTGAQLFGANLTASALSGAVLRSSDLTDANLSGADLSGADLEGVMSSGITSTPIALPTPWSLIDGYLIGPGANLADAELSYANLSNADMSKADLSFADLSHADLSNANLSGANVSGADLATLNWFGLLCPIGRYNNDNRNSCDNSLRPT
jgi:uncharacterized protein YjbI with pentapeptide repeats